MAGGRAKKSAKKRTKRRLTHHNETGKGSRGPYDANKRKIEQNKRALVGAMREELGIVSAACEKAGIGRTTYYEYYRTDADFREEIDSIADRALDFAEQALLENIRLRKEKSIIFYLITKGRKRGYMPVQKRVQRNLNTDGAENLSDAELDREIKKFESS